MTLRNGLIIGTGMGRDKPRDMKRHCASLKSQRGKTFRHSTVLRDEQASQEPDPRTFQRLADMVNPAQIAQQRQGWLPWSNATPPWNPKGLSALESVALGPTLRVP